MADKHEGGTVNGANAANKGRIVESPTVTMELDEFIRDIESNIQKGGAIWVASYLQALDGCQARVGVLAKLACTVFKFLDLV
jgi:hypothetical protein